MSKVQVTVMFEFDIEAFNREYVPSEEVAGTGPEDIEAAVEYSIRGLIEYTAGVCEPDWRITEPDKTVVVINVHQEPIARVAPEVQSFADTVFDWEDLYSIEAFCLGVSAKQDKSKEEEEG